LNLPERHLGLIPTLEPGRWRAWLDAAQTKIAATVDLDRVLELARRAPLLPLSDDKPFAFDQTTHAIIAIARDAAFNFIYEDNLDLLRAAGAAIAFFSPLDDAALPCGTQALYLCGGFPEIYAAGLAANAALHAEIRAAFRAGMPIYAECGGLMYLTEAIVDQEDRTHPMVGILRGQSRMTARLTLGYRTLRAPRDSWLWRVGETMRGHEFHYSNWDARGADIAPAYELLSDGARTEQQTEGAQVGNLFASYVHLHFLARPELAARFCAAAASTKPWEGAR
jgi:cobyrinic acid a,c-diamide synthase